MTAETFPRYRHFGHRDGRAPAAARRISFRDIDNSDESHNQRSCRDHREGPIDESLRVVTLFGEPRPVDESHAGSALDEWVAVGQLGNRLTTESERPREPPGAPGRILGLQQQLAIAESCPRLGVRDAVPPCEYPLELQERLGMRPIARAARAAAADVSSTRG